MYADVFLKFTCVQSVLQTPKMLKLSLSGGTTIVGVTWCPTLMTPASKDLGVSRYVNSKPELSITPAQGRYIILIHLQGVFVYIQLIYRVFLNACIRIYYIVEHTHDVATAQWTSCV